MEMAEVLRRRRAELGMSQSDLAAAAGVDARQIRRYEAGEQQPVLDVAVRIAAALQISVGELAGIPNHKVNLTGDWFTGWQSYKDGQEVVAVQPVRITQEGDRLEINALERGRPVEEGGYLWRGELRLWDNDTLMGWYASVDSTVTSKGTMFFVLGRQGLTMEGRWVGASYDGQMVTGLGSMARTADEARSIIGRSSQPGLSGTAAAPGD